MSNLRNFETTKPELEYYLISLITENNFFLMTFPLSKKINSQGSLINIIDYSTIGKISHICMGGTPYVVFIGPVFRYSNNTLDIEPMNQWKKKCVGLQGT